MRQGTLSSLCFTSRQEPLTCFFSRALTALFFYFWSFSFFFVYAHTPFRTPRRHSEGLAPGLFATHRSRAIFCELSLTQVL